MQFYMRAQNSVEILFVCSLVYCSEALEIHKPTCSPSATVSLESIINTAYNLISATSDIYYNEYIAYSQDSI